MKNLFTVVFLLLTLAVTAQEGEVIYKTTINIHKQLRGPRAEQFKKSLPEFQSFKQVLHFNETEALFQKYKEETDVVEADIEDDRSRRFMMRMMGGGDEDRFYTNHDEGTVIQKRDFLGKTFLITDDQREMKWKLTGEQKTINGYLCMKAELQIDTTQQEDFGRGGRGRSRNGAVIAWFTPQIQVPVGPNEYAGLPGLIMQVEIGEGGNNVITAETITLKTLEKGTIEQPKGGKKVTREEFRTIVKEKMEEMRKERGGNGGGGRRETIIRND